MIDYEEFNFTALPEVIRLVLSKGYIYTEHFAPHDIRVTEYSSGRTRQQVAADLGIDFTIAPKWGREEGISSVQRLLGNMWIDHDKAERVLECLVGYRFDYDEDKRAFKTIPRHDHTSHCADALRYYATAKRTPCRSARALGGRSRWLV